MNVYVTGAGGLVGNALLPLLKDAGHKVIALTRSEPKDDQQRQWDPQAETMDPAVLDGCDVLVHLAGESIAEGRWTKDKKRKIYDSRVNSTKLLAKTISQMDAKPKAFIVASAIGYYGDRDTEVLTESSPPGEGYLPEVCVHWEEAADAARDAGIRTVHVRTGVVLAKEGGALKAMLTPFKLGVGGNMGNGKQYWSWISLEDIARLFHFAVENESMIGPVNGTAPNPCTNHEFTKALGKVISRPTLIPMPKFAAKLVLGEMAEALILASARVMPVTAEEQSFQFQHPELVQALESLNL
ncbi:TIGR01777 family oxidoreductase [bacterium]|mgnify:CR=1 FL=1|jgi:uncharacterized protein (TIGR01777 family)|nr:TIGR01777 family protein [Planctomicrobium sp.]MDB4731855.1 TIGR01777 family oxidoreductase [bacterium]